MGWKLKLRQEFAYIGGVEREPMWDGNMNSLPTLKFSKLLSENQCGMETGRSKPLFRVLPVEREPMWDGNESRNGTRPGIAPLSENQCGMETT